MHAGSAQPAPGDLRSHMVVSDGAPGLNAGGADAAPSPDRSPIAASRSAAPIPMPPSRRPAGAAKPPQLGRRSGSRKPVMLAYTCTDLYRAAMAALYSG